MNFFSREAIRKRRERTIDIRSRTLSKEKKSGSLFKSHSIRKNKPLNVIIEEDESRPSSRAPSPSQSSYPENASARGSQSLLDKKRRRNASVDITLVRALPIAINNDLSLLEETSFLAASLPAHQPTPIFKESSDSFKLRFSRLSLDFPSPPQCFPSPSPSSPNHLLHYYFNLSDNGSPVPSSSSTSSPCSSAVPTTPSDSDDESSTRPFNPRRVSIKPLTDDKIHPRPRSPFVNILSEPTPSLIEPLDSWPEETTPPANLSSFARPELDESEGESDSEWYTRQFSKILTLGSPIPPSFPNQNPSRPESMSINLEHLPRRSSIRRRSSTILPPLPRDYAKRSSNRPRSILIPKYPPPPVPLVSATSPRPPPRSSVPADFEFELEIDEHEHSSSVTDDSSSSFSFSMYEIDLDHESEDIPQAEIPSVFLHPPFIASPSPNVFGDHEVSFDPESSLMLPVSLPATPVDFEADLSAKGGADGEEYPEFVLEDIEEELESQETDVVVIQPEAQPADAEDLYSPLSPFFSYSPKPFSDRRSANPSPPPPPHVPSSKKTRGLINKERILKSKWSTTTLASVREEHERRGTSSKITQYFGSTGHAPLKINKPPHRQFSSKKSPVSPTSPVVSLLSPKKAGRLRTSPTSSPSPRLSPRSAKSLRCHARESSNSDIMVIGYGSNGVGE